MDAADEGLESSPSYPGDLDRASRTEEKEVLVVVSGSSSTTSSSACNSANQSDNMNMNTNIDDVNSISHSSISAITSTSSSVDVEPDGDLIITTGAASSASSTLMNEDEASVTTKYKLYDVPSLSTSKLVKDFVLDEYDIEVTSLDITVHGFFVLAGCGNGMVLLYDMTSPASRGILVGHIQAKGLHTNLLLQVQITDDCRFCFAGVQKGSSEMLAIDLGRLSPSGANKRGSISSSTAASGSGSGGSGGYSPLDWITTHSYSDAKLRGFCASTRFVSISDQNLFSPNNTNEYNPMAQPMKYRLACGRGIKNVHVWQFEPDIFVKQKSGEMVRTPTWSCIYDVASNGNTIESIAFRDYGNQVISKSAGVVLRLWDLKKAAETPSEKPGYEDIHNSADVKRVFDKYSFGGTYEFAVVNISAPKTANRDSYEMPERTTDDENGQRRRRMMRQIEDVVGTSDGQHVLALCTDGGVMYFNRNEEHRSPEIMEFGTIRDPDVDSGWAIKRVGTAGEVVLLRAMKTSKKTTIRVNPLVENMTPESRLKFPSTGTHAVSNSGYYFEISKENKFALVDDLHCIEAIGETNSCSNADKDRKPPSRNRKTTISTSDVKMDVSNDKEKSPEISEHKSSSSSSSSSSFSRSRSSIAPTPDKNCSVDFITPAHAVASAGTHNKVTPSDILDRFGNMDQSISSPILKRKRVRSSAASKDKKSDVIVSSSTGISSTAAAATTDVEIEPSSLSKKFAKDVVSTSQSSVAFEVSFDNALNQKPQNYHRKPVHVIEMIEPTIGPPPRVKRIVESHEVFPLPPLSDFAKSIWSAFQALKNSFIDNQKLVSTSADAVFSYDTSKLGIPLGAFSLQQMSVIRHEQLALKSRFLYDVERIVAFHAAENLLAVEKYVENSISSELLLKYLPLPDNETSAADVISRYLLSVHDLLIKQQMDMNIAWDMDNFFSANLNKKLRCPAIVFQFDDLFDSASSFIDEVNTIFHSIHLHKTPMGSVNTIAFDNSDSLESNNTNNVTSMMVSLDGSDVSASSDREVLCL